MDDMMEVAIETAQTMANTRQKVVYIASNAEIGVWSVMLEINDRIREVMTDIIEIHPQPKN